MAGRRGAPLKFKTVKILKDKCDKYFHDCVYDKKGKKRKPEIPLTITGLALALNTTRLGLITYEERKDYANTIKEAKTKVENFAEKKLYGHNVAGAIFALKNFGWRDKTEQDITMKSTVKIAVKHSAEGEDE